MTYTTFKIKGSYKMLFITFVNDLQLIVLILNTIRYFEVLIKEIS